MTQQAKFGDTVRIHYQASSKEGVIFNSKNQLSPLQLTIGKAEIIPAFERALVGMQVGEKKRISLSAKEAFGPYLQELVTTIAKTQLPPDFEFHIGQLLQVDQPTGKSIIVQVVNSNDQSVTFDANHPLAGKDLVFDIELLEVVK